MRWSDGGAGQLQAPLRTETDGSVRRRSAAPGRRCFPERLRHGSKAVLDRLQTYQPVDPSEYYASVSPSFDAPEGPHDWLCKTMFVGKVDRKADRAVFTYWSVG